MLLSAAGIRRLSFDTDVLSLLPRDGRVFPAFRAFLSTFGSLDQLYVIFEAPEGHSIGDYEDDVDAWVDALRQTPGIGRVDTGRFDASRDIGWLADRQLLLLPDAALREALGRFRADGMGVSLAERRELLQFPSAAVAGLVRQDPLGLFDLMRSALGGAQAGLNVGVLEGGYVSKDGRSRLVIAQPTRPPYDAAFSRALSDRLDRIRASLTPGGAGDFRLKAEATGAPQPERATPAAPTAEATGATPSERNTPAAPTAEAARATPSGHTDEDPKGEATTAQPPPAADEETLPAMSVSFAGGHLIAVDTARLMKRESISNTTGSLLLILPLLFIVFRSVWLVVVGPLPSAVSLVAVLGLLGLAGATLSAAATASAAMLFGLGVDGVVLLYVAYTHARQGGLDPDDAVTSLSGSAYSMMLGMWTTAATFYGLAFVDFPSLEQLGRLIGHAMLACGLFTLVLVPALLPKASLRRRALAMPGLARWIARWKRPALGAALLVTLVLGAAAFRLRINPTLDRLRSVTPAAQLASRIGPMFGLPDDVYVVVSSGADLQPLLDSNERLTTALATGAPTVAVQAPATLLPSDATQARRAASIAGAGLTGGGVTDVLAHAAANAGFRAGTFAPFVERLPRLLDTGQRITFEDYTRHGLGDLVGRFVAHTPDGWMLATYVFPKTPDEVAAVERIVGETDASATLTGLPLVNSELAARFLPQFLRGLGIGSLIVLVIVVLAFRAWRLSLLALLPTALGLVWAAGLLALARVELDLFALFAVVTFVGIGVDYGIHLVERYRETGDARRAIEELAPVILVAAAITVFGYGTLVTSSYPPLRSIGLVSAVSVTTLAVTSVIVLPALLASGVGRAREDTRR